METAVRPRVKSIESKLPIQQERILLAGAAGVGKTYAWLTLARALPSVKFYVIDPDDGVRRAWYSEFSEVKNIEYYFTPKWFGPIIQITGEPNCFTGGVSNAFKEVRKKVKKGDWLVIEQLGNLWNVVQDSYADEVYQKDIGQYFLDVRKALREGAKVLDALKGRVDWQVIKKLHNDDFITAACFELPSHLLVTTAVVGAPDIKDQSEDPDIRAFYGDSRLRLEGEKNNPFRMQTILLLSADGKGELRKYYMSTYLKDRAREWVEKIELIDFAFQYLQDVAGWSLNNQ